MCQASDTATANHLCPTVVAKLMKPFHAAKQAQRELLKRRQNLVARPSPEPKFDIWIQEG
jgi:hypothetical protein